MTISRPFQDIRILIPGYSIEDLPTDLPEDSANSLLNAFAVAWHPWLLHQSRSLPDAHRAESLEMPTGPHVLLVPDCSIDWLEHDWKQRFTDVGNVVFSHCSSREEWLDAIHAEFRPANSDDETTAAEGGSAVSEPKWPEVPADLLADFFALGTASLQVRLLSRRLHHFVDPDAFRLESAAHDAAEAAVCGDFQKARENLQHAFEALLDCREQVHPTDCYLVDICLPSDQTSAIELRSLIRESQALSIICSGEGLQRLDSQDESFRQDVQQAFAENRLSLLTGHFHELRTASGSVSSTYSDLKAAVQQVKSYDSSATLNWARRRFGLCSALPTLLNLFDFQSALHVVLDDGVYPDREYGQMNWEAADGSRIPAVSRIPMAIDSGSTFLRLVDRCAESMQEDSSAVMLLARLPQLHTPWLTDLQNAAKYAPVLGRFVTMSEFVSMTRAHSSSIRHDDSEYLSPHLIQSSVLKTEAPVSSPAELHLAWSNLESAALAETISAILKPSQFTDSQLPAFEQNLAQEEAARLALSSAPADTPQNQAARLTSITTAIRRTSSDCAQRTLELVPATAADVRGVFLMNPVPWARQVAVKWPTNLRPPANRHAIESVWQQGKDLHVSVNLPAGGFAWLTEASDTEKTVNVQKPGGKALAEGLILRNQFYEVELSERSGGIMSVMFHGTRNNRVSQQVAFRYENSKTVTVDEEQVQTSYAVARMVSSKVLSSGPFTGSIQTTNEIVDAVDGKVRATFRQTTTVQRNSSKLKILIEFDEIAQPVTGNPWMTYFGCRFAWDNESAAIVRSVLGQAVGFRMERFEAPDFIEVSDSDGRLLILPHGRPYHRRTAARMLDSLLLVEGETATSFRFTLDFDQRYPTRCAMEQQQAPILIDTASTVPAADNSAWIMGLTAKNVIIARSRVERCDAVSHEGGSSGPASETVVVLLLQETEGCSADCILKTARLPRSSRLRSAGGETLQPLTVASEGIRIPISRFQFKEVELRF